LVPRNVMLLRMHFTCTYGSSRRMASRTILSHELAHSSLRCSTSNTGTIMREMGPA
jgi:hypothetical protein